MQVTGYCLLLTIIQLLTGLPVTSITFQGLFKWSAFISNAVAINNGLTLTINFLICTVEDILRICRWLIWRLKGRASWCISVVKRTICTTFSNSFYFVVALYMFRTDVPSIIRSLRLYIQHQVYVIHFVPASKQSAQSVWHIPDAHVQS